MSFGLLGLRRVPSWVLSVVVDKERRAGSGSAQPGVPGEWSQFAVGSKETGGLAGDCALRVDGQEPFRAEIGFTLAREHRGKGFASEAVPRLLDYTFDTLGLPRVVAIADCRRTYPPGRCWSG